MKSSQTIERDGMTDLMTHAAAVRYRAAAAALRGIRARAGRTNATFNAIDRHEANKKVALHELMFHHRRDVVGLLVSEENLAERVRQARLLGQARPELAARLRTTRRELKGLA